jgi:hypothetical protein
MPDIPCYHWNHEFPLWQDHVLSLVIAWRVASPETPHEARHKKAPAIKVKKYRFPQLRLKTEKTAMID